VLKGLKPSELHGLTDGRIRIAAAHDAERPEEIVDLMLAELQDTQATTVESLEFTLRLPRDVEPRIYGTSPLARDAEGCDVLAGSVLGNATRRIVVESHSFDRSCSDLPEMRSTAHSLHRFSPTMTHTYRAVSAKEVLLHAYKLSRGESDRRSASRDDIETYIAEEEELWKRRP